MIGGVRIDRCASCDGTWFDEHELSQLLAEEMSNVADLRRGKVDDKADRRVGLCPKDGSHLLRIFSAIDRNVVLDTCADCHGIWLDGGEFDKLYAARRLRQRE